MSVEGLYVVYYGDIAGSPLPFGMKNAGMLVLETGSVLGGDLQFTYVGSYEVTGDILRAHVLCERHQGPGYTVWNSQEPQFEVDFVGRRVGQNIEGHMERGPQQLPAKLEWKSSLP